MRAIIIPIVSIALTGCAVQVGQQAWHANGQPKSAFYLASDFGRDVDQTATGPAGTATGGQNESDTAKHAMTAAATYGAAKLLAETAQAKDAGEQATAKTEINGEVARDAARQATIRDAAANETLRANFVP